MDIRIKQLFQDNRTPTLSLYDHHISRLSNPIHRKQSQICHKQLSTSASRIDQPLQKPPGPINHCAHAGPNPPRSGPFTSYLPPTNPQNVPRPPLKRVFAPPKRLQSPPRPNLRPLHKHDPDPHSRAPTIRLPLLRNPRRTCTSPSRQPLVLRARAGDPGEYQLEEAVAGDEVLE